MLAATADIPGAVPVSEQAGVRLRPLTVSDCHRLSRWMRLSKDLSKPRYGTGYFAKYCVKEAGPDTCYMAICLGSALIGYVGYGGHGDVNIYIRPENRGKGIGTKAMKMLFHEAAKRRCMKLAVTVSRTDFFSRLGFKAQGFSGRLSEADRLHGRVVMLWGDWKGGRYGAR